MKRCDGSVTVRRHSCRSVFGTRRSRHHRRTRIGRPYWAAEARSTRVTARNTRARKRTRPAQAVHTTRRVARGDQPFSEMPRSREQGVSCALTAPAPAVPITSYSRGCARQSKRCPERTLSRLCLSLSPGSPPAGRRHLVQRRL